MAREVVSQNGDGFRVLFEMHRDTVFRLLYRLAGDRHDAEDLLQETFARLWRKRAQFRGDGSLEGYLRKIAYRVYLNARPRLQRGRATRPLDPETLDGGDGPAERAALREDVARVRRVVDELPDSWREPFVLYRYEGLRCREVAEVLGITAKAVEIRVTRALKQVSKRLKELPAR